MATINTTGNTTTDNTRKCNKCKQSKSLTDDYYNSLYKICKLCHSARVKRNQIKKTDHYNAYRKTYQEQHPEKVEQWRTEYVKNKEVETGIPFNEYCNNLVKQRLLDNPLSDSKKKEINKKRRKYRKENIERIKQSAREHYQRNREKIIKKSTEYNNKKKNEKRDQTTKTND